MGRPRESALTQHPAAVTVVVFSDVSPTRDGITIYNNSADNLYVALGETVSTTAFTVKMVPDAYYEVPERWQGKVCGTWDGTDGDAQVTEFFI